MSDAHVPQPPGGFLTPGVLLLGSAALMAAILYGTHAGIREDAVPRHDHMAMTATSGSGAGLAGQRPATIVRPVSCEKLPNVPGKSITTVVVDFPPGAFSPRHRHPGSVTAFMLKGKVRSQLDGGPVETFAVGQSWFEPPGTVHDFAENASATEPAALLAIFVADDDCGPLTVYD